MCSLESNIYVINLMGELQNCKPQSIAKVNEKEEFIFEANTIFNFQFTIFDFLFLIFSPRFPSSLGVFATLIFFLRIFNP